MKKNEKISKKTKSNGKKKSAKRKKSIISDALRAFLLVAVLTVFAAAISLVIITIHSRIKNAPPAATENEAVAAIENITEKNIEQNKNEINPPAPENNNRAQTQPERETIPALPESVSAPAPSNPNPAPPTVSTVPVSTQRPTQNTGTLAFVIDDAGNNLHELDPFLRIPGPLTIAVMPGLPYSAEAARRIRAAGKDVILHQPMEAIGAQNPGPGAIYSGMGEEEIRSILTRNIAEVGPVAGINNHQGSKISMDEEIAQIILKFCAEQGIYFLDSRTTAETVFPVYAQRLGMKIAERNVFLDNEQDRNSMLRYITSGLTIAQRNGSAIMIGHVWSPELAPLLAEQFPILTIQGYTIKTVSGMMGNRE